MIFKNCDFIENLNTEALKSHFGNIKKRPFNGNAKRSSMMVNPLKLKHINHIDAMDADMVSINLEDAIAPSRKKEALYNTALFLSHMSQSRSQIIVRVNPLDEGGAQEIAFLNDFGFDAVRVSKVKTKEDIARALELLDEDKELHISMETKEAFMNLRSLRIDERFTTANIGILDLLNSLGLPQSLVKINNPTIDYILSKFLIDAKSVGLHPVSFMYQDYLNTDAFRTWCEREKMMGFTTKACLGPKQTKIANEVFGVSESEVHRARYIVHLYEKNVILGDAGFMDEQYGFIDEPIYKDAKMILEGR